MDTQQLSTSPIWLLRPKILARVNKDVESLADEAEAKAILPISQSAKTIIFNQQDDLVVPDGRRSSDNMFHYGLCARRDG